MTSSGRSRGGSTACSPCADDRARLSPVDGPSTARTWRLGIGRAEGVPLGCHASGRLAAGDHGHDAGQRRARERSFRGCAVRPPPASRRIRRYSRGARPGSPLSAVVRSTAALPACDFTSVDGIPSTSPTRTLIDLGGRLPRPTIRGRARHRNRPRTRRRRRGSRRAHVRLWTPRRSRLRGGARAPRASASRPCTSREPLGSAGGADRRAAGLPDPDAATTQSSSVGDVAYLDFAWPDREGRGRVRRLRAALHRGGSSTTTGRARTTSSTTSWWVYRVTDDDARRRSGRRASVRSRGARPDG